MRGGGRRPHLQVLVPVFLICVVGLCLFRSNLPHPATSGEVDPYAAAAKAYNALNLSALPPITLWSSDFHISPIADLKHLLRDFHVRVIDKSLSGHCHLSNTCATDLDVITQANGIHLSPCPNSLRRDFYNRYRNDPEFMSADAIVCTHAISMCELFMPFGKPLILLASTRYEIGRHDKVDWERWNHNLELIASKPYNTLGANNKYDAEYIKYFTQIRDVALLPSYCEYVNTVYKPQRGKPFLLAPARGVNHMISRQLQTSLQAFNAKQEAPVRIVPIRELYPLHFEYSDLAAHPAIVLLPYQVSVMSLFEFYRMAIPLFVPSLRLLTQWHLEHRVVSERSWAAVYGQPARHSALPKHTNSSSSMHYDPNDEFDADAVGEWLALSDFYQWPHIQVFASFEDLFLQLQRVDLAATSQAMHAHNARVKADLKTQWKAILQRVHAHRDQRGVQTLPVDVNVALEAEYGVHLHPSDCHRQEDTGGGGGG